MRDLTGKYCIVTGAGKGIGKAIAKRFLEEEAAGVAILEWNLELAQATAKELDPTGEKVIAVKCNVADSDMVKAAIDETVRKFGRIDVLINNAGNMLAGFLCVPLFRLMGVQLTMFLFAGLQLISGICYYIYMKKNNIR